MNKIKYSLWIFCLLLGVFLSAWFLSRANWQYGLALGAMLCVLLSLGFHALLEKRIVKLSQNIDSKRSSDIQVKRVGSVKKFFGGALLTLETKIHRLKKQQRKMIDDLSLEKNKLSAILLQMNEGVMMLGHEDKIIFYNPAFKKIVGMDKNLSNIEGAFVGEVVFRAQILEALNKLKRQNKPVEEHIVFFDLGKAKHIYLQMVKLGEKKHQSVLMTLKDISKDKRLEKNKNIMLENISHELRTPLTVILGYLDILKQTQSNADETSYVKIRENVERMIGLTEEILNASQWKEESFEKKQHSFDPQPLVLSVVENYQNIAKAKNIALQFKPHAQLQNSVLSIEGNKDQFYQVIQNLIDNAIKYTQDGKVEVVMHLEDSVLHLKVTDTGFGFEPHEKKNVFKRFYRVDRARSKPGSGLGLSIVKAYLDQWSVAWNVESKPNHGTEFKMSFQCL